MPIVIAAVGEELEIPCPAAILAESTNAALCLRYAIVMIQICTIEK